jgi:two-component system response regulator YesN
MAFKVFLVEDEIVTREGIRDKVNWQGNGFVLCGEAADGEMALPLIQAAHPQVLITDIKMPFMDGLQLSKIIRERMPGVKIVILSGHDEFEYAQDAIQIGVTEYLLKPVTVNDLHRVLQKLAVQLEQEQKEHNARLKLQEQVAESQALLREKLLFKLVVGAISSVEAMEQSQALGLDLVARCYLVILIKVELGDRSDQFDYDEYKHILKVISGLVENDPDLFLLQKDWEELLLVIKGNAPEFLLEQRDRLEQSLREMTQKTRYQIKLGVGQIKHRLTELRQSFVEALMSMQGASDGLAPFQADLLQMDKTAVESYLRSGSKNEFIPFIKAYLRPLGDRILLSALLKHYILVDIVLAAARLVSELGGDVETILPQLSTIEQISADITSIEQLQGQAWGILSRALTFRDSQNKNPYVGIIQQAKDYLTEHYRDAALSLGDVAGQVNLSPSHFSVIFSQEIGQNFKEYLTELRIQKAKELLRASHLKTAEIAYQVGYNDPHYFSVVFHKVTGLTPTEFRAQVYRSQL